MIPPVHRVVVLVLDGVLPFDMGIPGHIFFPARGLYGAHLYEVVTASLDGGPVRTASDFSVTAPHGAEILATADTVVVPAANGVVTDACAEGRLPQAVADALGQVRPGTRLMSIGTGAYVLAAAGVLDGRPATTARENIDHFERTFPEVIVERDVLFVDDGDVLTSAGRVAGNDMCLHVVVCDHGLRVANAVARWCMLAPFAEEKPADDAARPVPDEAEMTTAPTQAWALEHLHLPLTLAQLAAHAHMSRRSFTRHFRDEVGTSPARWLTLQRVDLAQHLLETTNTTVEEVAERAGFGTATSLRQHLQAATGVAPVAYRRTYRVVQAMAPTE